MRAVVGITTPRGTRISGARIYDKILTVSTLLFGPEGDLTLYGQGCFTLALGGRTTDATTAFRKAARERCRLAAIHTLYLRDTGERGKGTGTHMAFKVEAALDLTPGVKLEIIHEGRLRAWRERAKGSLPAPLGTMTRQIAMCHRQAIEIAAFVAFVGEASIKQRLRLTPAQIATLTQQE